MVKDVAKLPMAPLERLLKEQGAHRVSKSALSEFAGVLEEIGSELASEAVRLAKHAGRKTVHASDVRLARRRGF